MTDQSCAALPSSDAACRLVAGDLSAIPKVLGTLALRTGLCAGGMLIAGAREHVVRDAFGAAMAIEAFVLGWAAVKTYQAAAAAAAGGAGG